MPLVALLAWVCGVLIGCSVVVLVLGAKPRVFLVLASQGSMMELSLQISLLFTYFSNPRMKVDIIRTEGKYNIVSMVCFDG